MAKMVAQGSAAAFRLAAERGRSPQGSDKPVCPAWWFAKRFAPSPCPVPGAAVRNWAARGAPGVTPAAGERLGVAGEEGWVGSV